MFYLANKIIRISCNFLFIAVLLIPIFFLIIFFELMNRLTWYEIFLWLFLLLFAAVSTLLLIFLIRIYQIIDKWDQLFSIKNASKFLDLGIDGEKHLQFNLTQKEIWRLRERYQNQSTKPKP